MVSTTRYKKINTNLTEFELPEVISYLPQPTDVEYKRGYIKRYFVQKANDVDSYIFEVSSDSFTEYTINPYFTIVSILWKISGNHTEISESNMKSVKLGCETMPMLYKYLQNPLQFVKF